MSVTLLVIPHVKLNSDMPENHWSCLSRYVLKATGIFVCKTTTEEGIGNKSVTMWPLTGMQSLVPNIVRHQKGSGRWAVRNFLTSNTSVNLNKNNVNLFFYIQIKDVPSLLCEVNTKARLTCLAVWLDRASEIKENSDKVATLSQGKRTACFFSCWYDCEMKYTMWDCLSVCIGKSFGILKNWG